MKLEFAHKEINEYANGPLHLKREDQPFEVDAAALPDLLRSRSYIGGEYVETFRPADSAARTEEVRIIEDAYPDDFPHADKLVAAGVRLDEVRRMRRDELIAVKGIGEKTADAILAYGDRQVEEAEKQ